MLLTEDSRIRPLEITTYSELSQWCRHYQRYNKYPANIIERFAIGLYQIHQGMEWKDKDNRAESYMSACLHFLMVCESLELPLLVEINTVPHMHLKSERILYLISKVQQQIFYFHKSTVRSNDGKPYQRASRYDKIKTANYFKELIELLISVVAPENRSQGLIDASKIMSGIL